MAIRSHPGVQKMPACGIPSELSAHQMAPAGAISGHGNEEPPLGNGVLLYLVPGHALSFPVLTVSCVPLFNRSSTFRFEVCVLQKLSPLNSCEGVPTQAFGAFLRDVSQAPLPDFLEPSLTVQMYDLYCGLASYGSYVSALVIFLVYSVFFFPTSFHRGRLHRHLELSEGP